MISRLFFWLASQKKGTMRIDLEWVFFTTWKHPKNPLFIPDS